MDKKKIKESINHWHELFREQLPLTDGKQDAKFMLGYYAGRKDAEIVRLKELSNGR